jgi:hypothetical protein
MDIHAIAPGFQNLTEESNTATAAISRADATVQPVAAVT